MNSKHRNKIKTICKRAGMEPSFYSVWFNFLDSSDSSAVENILEEMEDSTKEELEILTRTLHNKNNAEKQGNRGYWDKIFQSKN